MEGPGITYFSMEIGLRVRMPTYSGGLAILTGDMIISSANPNILLVPGMLTNR